jgi:hypothetical protein
MLLIISSLTTLDEDGGEFIHLATGLDGIFEKLGVVLVASALTVRVTIAVRA